MEYNKLPLFIRQSAELSQKDIESLLTVTTLPTEQEVDAIRHLPEIQELTNAFIGDDSTRNTHLQLKAKAYIADQDVNMAWKVLLL